MRKLAHREQKNKSPNAALGAQAYLGVLMVLLDVILVLWLLLVPVEAVGVDASLVGASAQQCSSCFAQQLWLWLWLWDAVAWLVLRVLLVLATGSKGCG